MKNALIVDDDSLFCWALRKELAFQGFDVAVAGSGRECLAFAEVRRFDLVFLDIHLPDANGIDLLPELRRASPGTRFVVASWDGTARNKESALAAGAEQFLEKPFEIDVVSRYLTGMFRGDGCQRRQVRYLCNFPLRFAILEPAPDEAHLHLGSMRGTAEDVARSGIRLTTDYPLRPGQSVRVRVDGEPDPFGRMLPDDACAEVVWSVPRGNRATAGLRFLAEAPVHV